MSGKSTSKRTWSICVVATVAAIAVLSAGSPVWAEIVIDVADMVVDNTGDSVTSPIMVNDVESPYNLGGGTIKVNFDSTVVNVTGVASGDLSIWYWSDDTHVSGNIYSLIMMGAASSGQTGDVVFANVTWQAVGSAGDSCDLAVEYPSDLANYDPVGTIPSSAYSVNDGSFTIVPEPSSLVLLASLAVSGGLMVLWRRRRR